jgi:hypothetical protein
MDEPRARKHCPCQPEVRVKSYSDPFVDQPEGSVVGQFGQSMSSKVDQFVDLLQGYRSNGSVSNPWVDRDPDFDRDHAPRDRTDYLRAYFNARLNTAEALLIAEAPGYQGAKFSGIAMTCERTLLGYRPGVSRLDVFDETIERHRTSRPPEASSQAVRQCGFCEPTAAYVWPAIAGELSKKIVLWNIFGFHPHKDVSTLTNRTPKDTEIRSNRHVLEAFLRLFPDLPILSIGKKSEECLKEWGSRHELSFARHPANGGGTIFREKFTEFLKTVGLLA